MKNGLAEPLCCRAGPCREVTGRPGHARVTSTGEVEAWYSTGCEQATQPEPRFLYQE